MTLVRRTSKGPTHLTVRRRLADETPGGTREQPNPEVILQKVSKGSNDEGESLTKGNPLYREIPY